MEYSKLLKIQVPLTVRSTFIRGRIIMLIIEGIRVFGLSKATNSRRGAVRES